MEESTKKGEALAGSVSECTVAARASEQTLGQAIGSLGEGFEGNGDDLMVEVVGSEVYVGGVCTSGTGENVEDSGPERAENGGWVEELGSVETGVSGIENEDSLVVSESVEEHDFVVAVKESEIVGGAGEKARNLESSCAVEGSVCVQIQVDAVSKAELITREGESKAVAGASVVVSVEDKQDIEIREETVQDLEIEKVDGAGVPVPGSRIAEEGIVRESSELVSKLAVQEEFDYGKGTVMTNPATVEDSGVVTRVREENSAAALNMETSVGESETLNGLDEKEHVTSENSGGNAENHNEDPTSSCPPNHVGDKSEVTVSEVVSVSEQAEKAGDKAQLESYNGQQVEADEVQVTCAELAGLNEGDKERAQSSDHLNEEDVTSDVSPVSGDKEDTFDRDQVGSHEEEQVELRSQQETSEKMDEDSHAVNDMVPDSVGETELPISSDFQAETASRSTGMDVEVGDYVDDMCPMDTEEVMISEMEVLEHPDTDQQLSTEEYLGKDVTAVDGVVTASDGFGLQEERDSVPVEETISIAETLEPSYELVPEHEGVLSLHDLVWGKVKSHPWWPGQIFDFTDASEKALKHHKKDCLLVAYFGDRTFSWNEESTLKSFRAHFSEMVAQSNGETFHNAVDCALEEVSRRVELGLACSCIPKDFNDDVRVQVVENAGIRPESNRREGLDESTGVSFFQPNKFVKYVRSLAQSSLGNTDALGLTVAKAQLLAFARFKGFGSLPEFQFCGDMIENDTASQHEDTHRDDKHNSPSQGKVKVYKSSNKRKHDLRVGIHHKIIKEKSMSELMGDNAVDYPDEEHVSGKRRRSGESHHGDDSTSREGRKTIPHAKPSTPPKQSFKIGECMRRVASQMKGSATATATATAAAGDGNGNGNGNGNDISSQNSEGVKAAADPPEYSSLDELLFQLHSLARDPNKEYSFSNVIVNFFSDFRNSVIDGRHPSVAELLIPDKVGGKRKKMSPETFDFDDMSDTYWTDRVIQNGAEEQPQPPQAQAQEPQAQPQEPQAQPQEPQVQPQEPQVQPQPQQPSARKVRKKENTPEKTPKTKRPYNRKQFSNGAAATLMPRKPASEKPPGYVGANAPTELAMIFTEAKSVPSETSLNKMFRRFGPLKEGETEVERESGRARVVFKKCSDAEVALNSAAKFSIFGAAVVSYELNYNPVVQYKPSPIVATLDDHHHHHHDHDDIQLDIHDMHLDLSPHDHDMELDLFEVSLV